MSNIKRTGLAACCLILAFAGGDAIKAKSKPEPAKPAVVQTPQPPTDAGYRKALEQENAVLRAERDERAKAANYWYSQAREYKALCQKHNNYQPASYASSGHYETRCQNGQCKRVWVADSPTKKTSAPKPVATVKPQVTYRQRGVFMGRFR